MEHLDNNDDINTNCAFYDCSTLENLFSSNIDNNIKLIHINIRNLSNLNSLLLSIANLDISVLVLTEVWMDNLNDWTEIPGFKAYHTIRENRKGGGVTILVNEFIESVLLENISICNNLFESVGIDL